ncbi:MAG: hypothetical protein ACHQD9_01180 [Chitinophagales bacterium]
MSGLSILDLVAGMIFIYFLLSLICSAAFEAFSAATSIRAKLLEEWIRKTFADGKGDAVVNGLLDHPLANGLSKHGEATSYMSAKVFSETILNIISKLSNEVPKDLDDIKAKLEAFNQPGQPGFPEDIRRAFLIFISEAKTSVDKTKSEVEHFKESLEGWFDNMMDRIRGKYKKRSMRVTFLVAALATIGMNVDSISVARYLYADKSARDALAVAAYHAASDTSMKTQVAALKQQQQKERTDTALFDSMGQVISKIQNEKQRIDSLAGQLNNFIPLGWTAPEYKLFLNSNGNKNSTPGSFIFFIIMKIVGWTVTVFAVSLGAPFWFDVLGKVANLRNSIKPEKAS